MVSGELEGRGCGGMSQPKPWSMNEYGRVFDATKEPAILSGFSLSCGYSPAGCTPEQNDAEIVGAANCHADLLAALEDMYSGWLYIRKMHGDLYGVGWDRAQEKAEAALKKARGE